METMPSVKRGAIAIGRNCGISLFYWSLKRDNYWLAEYLSISSVIRRAPVGYGRAFLYTKTDELDCTYFVLNQLAVMKSAVGEFFDYIKRKMNEVRRLEQTIGESERFNGRQLALLRHASRTALASYTVASHARAHHISVQSARNDLRILEEDGLLQRRGARPIIWSPSADLANRLRVNPKD
jgi:Fic family protein